MLSSWDHSDTNGMHSETLLLWTKYQNDPFQLLEGKIPCYLALQK